ncbi:hypothetical protein AMAG_14500 [Allomyces macrogynus ATCC 38327]|uniref:Uncharacterized protein n=1 Tax=Allomyces macrogynus (strain ATCC 38327) TaxID=578462 RepID=A0A0L0T6I6_ALLM3|nr:hypothetical protein AMAG_14500 [Allomyces macrogynus ATCC 38327]|eukprot:KNE70360.1 hypothetical protein AMAG_14500 [Allomyces macrogynus ATCC 38327]
MTHLEDLIADRCRVSTHFAMLTLWYFQAYLADLEDFPSSAAYDMCVRVVSLVEDIIMAREEDTAEYLVESDVPAAIPPPTTMTPTKSSRDSAVNVHLDTPTKSPPRGSGSPPAPAMVTLAIGPNGTPLRLPNTTPSLEDMHKGKAFSFTNFVQRAAGGASATGTISKRSSMASSSVDDTPNNETSASGSVRARRGSTASVDSVLCNDPKLLEKYYFHSELQFIAALVAISERLVPVPREARQSTLTAELTLLNHNFPAPVCLPLWCHAAGEVRHHQIVRISPTDATVLNSAERVPFLMFVEVIEDDEADAHAAAAESTNALGVANDTTPRRMPIRRRSSLSMLLETPPASLTAMLNGSLSRRTSTISAASAAAAVNHAADDLGARGLPAEQQMQPEPAQAATAAARPSSMMSTTSTRRTEFPGEEEFANRMRTAVILLAQLQEQERQMLTAELAEAAAASSPAARRRALLKLRKKKKKKVGGPRLTEEIRNRILREMMALEELRLRALQELNALDIDEGDLGLASTMSQDVYRVLRACVARTTGLSGSSRFMERDSPLDCFAYTSLATNRCGRARRHAFDVAEPRANRQRHRRRPKSGAVSPTPASSSLAANALPVTKALRDRLLLSLSDKQVSDFVDRLIANSMGNVFTRLYDGYQWFVEGVMA